MRLLLFAFVSLTATIAPAAPAEAPAWRALMAAPETRGLYERQLGRECVRAIEKAGATAEGFDSPLLRGSARQLGDLPFASGRRDDTFYHWTSGTGLNELFDVPRLNAEDATRRARDENKFAEIFRFLRTRPDVTDHFWRGVFYVAEDPKSSREFGDRLFEFRLDPAALVLPYDPSLWTRAIDRMARRHPGLRACLGPRTWRESKVGLAVVKYHNLIFLLAEENGIFVVDYNQKNSWFMVLGPAPFREIRYVGKKR